jgi:hypothetical protein
MKNLKQLFNISLMSLLMLAVLVSCGSADDGSTSENIMQPEETEINTRSQESSIAKAYHYKDFARFEKGKATLELKDLASLAGKLVNLVVIYESTAPWAASLSDGKLDIVEDDKLNGLISSYELAVTQQFAIDDENHGIVLESKKQMDNPIEAAREISLLTHILMVHVKDVPSPENTEVADGH